jgi:ribosomal protein L11 methyltransferase
VITPKMSFGTGHHATTQLMMTLMQDIDFRDRTVFDFGSGTGILAILAAKLGASSVLAADNDEWSAENAQENVLQNSTPQVAVLHGSIEQAADKTYDVVLANINRHILLQYMHQMYACLNSGGTLLMSGLLTEDFDMVHDAAVNEGFSFVRRAEMNNWIAIQFAK